MSVLVAVVGLLCMVNLLVSARLARRLRSMDDLLRERAGSGRAIARFEANSTAGAAVGTALLTGTTLVGVFSVGCTPCAERLPGFLDLAVTRDRTSVLAVVVGAPELAAATVARLEPVAMVVREDEGGPVVAALGVDGYPWFLVLDDAGVVLTSGTTLGAVSLVA